MAANANAAARVVWRIVMVVSSMSGHIPGFGPVAHSPRKARAYCPFSSSRTGRLLFISRGNLLTRPRDVEVIGELADGGRLHQGRDPLLSFAPVRQCRLDRGLARGREIGDALALVDVPNLDPNQAAALQRIEVPAIVERSSEASAK